MSFIKEFFILVWTGLISITGWGVETYKAPVEIIPVATTTVVTEIKKEIGTTTIAASKSTTTSTTKKPGTSPIKNTEISSPVIPIVLTPEPPVDLEPVNHFARQATINILCTTKGGELSPISGTGVIVKPDGLILTNAHIAQYLLLKDFREKDFLTCVGRTGSPAYPKYKLELVYISPTWVTNNKTLLKENIQKGTGENDYAFLRITEMINGSSLPSSFAYIPINVRENIAPDEPVVLVSYPAGFLGGLSVLQNLHITSAITSIQDVFTFSEGVIDLIDVGGTVVSQRGSSGGLVVDKNYSLIGLISTSSDGDTTGERVLNAITSAYINRSINIALNITLNQFLNKDSAEFAKSFSTINVPTLSKLIIDEITK